MLVFLVPKRVHPSTARVYRRLGFRLGLSMVGYNNEAPVYAQWHASKWDRDGPCACLWPNSARPSVTQSDCMAQTQTN